MKKMSFIFSAALAIVAIGLAVFAAEGSSSPYSDPAGDVALANANGTADILGMEVSNTETDITFKLTVNGNVNTTDWAKFMIGIATGKTDGTQSGNGWGRPINLSYDNDPFAQNILGMNYWIGSWVDGSSQKPKGCTEFYSFDNNVGPSGAWTQVASSGTAAAPYPYPFIVTGGAQSTIEWGLPLSFMNLVPGDLIYFDVYSSGGGGGDTAIDSLANPLVTTNDWGAQYTSYSTAAGGPGLNSYTIAAIPEPSTIAMATGAAVAGAAMVRRRKKVV